MKKKLNAPISVPQRWRGKLTCAIGNLIITLRISN